jgi:hypothetical protein
MQEVCERVFVTDATSCSSGSDDVAVVDACKNQTKSGHASLGFPQAPPR